MPFFLKILTPALLLCAVTLHGQAMHCGADAMLGVHYNTLDADSYKRPIGYFAVGAHITLQDVDGPQRIYFNGRLTFCNDFHTYPLSPGTRLDCALRDLICSFQAHKKLNEKLIVYAGLNLSFNVINTIWFRAEGSAFTSQGQRSEAIESLVNQKMRKLNAGLEAGCMYPLGKGFHAGLQVTYYVLRRLNEDLAIGTGPLSAAENVSLNFRPVALNALCTLDLY